MSVVLVLFVHVPCKDYSYRLDVPPLFILTFRKSCIKEVELLIYSSRFEVKVDGCDHKLVIKDAHLDDTDEYTAQIGDQTSQAKLTVEGMNILWYTFVHLYVVELHVCSLTIINECRVASLSYLWFIVT